MRNSIVFLTMLGLVDHIESGYVAAEMTTSDGSLIMKEYPIDLFPCEIQEGDFFYISKVGGITEIRCGEPPE